MILQFVHWTRNGRPQTKNKVHVLRVLPVENYSTDLLCARPATPGQYQVPVPTNLKQGALFNSEYIYLYVSTLATTCPVAYGTGRCEG